MRPFRARDHAAVFGRIYRSRAWGGRESASGPGSTRARASDFLDDLLTLLERIEARVVLDAGCGDGNWVEPVATRVDAFIGVDVVRDLVTQAERRLGGPRRQFLHADITRDPLPRADVVLCRDCLVHFSFSDAQAALARLAESGSEYLLATTFVDRAENPDIRTGDWRPLNLEAPPFSLPRPLALVDERCVHTGGIYRDKRLGLWRLAA